MANQSAPTPNPDDLDASLERQVDDALADPDAALADAPSAPLADDAASARDAADKSMSDIQREMQQRLRDEEQPDATEPLAQPAAPEKIDPAQIASLDEQLADAAPSIDVDGDFESVDAAIGQIFDTRASVVQRAGKPAEVRDFPESERSRRAGGGPVRFQKNANTVDDDDDADAFAPTLPPSRAVEEKSDDDTPVEGVFEDVEVATAPQGAVASDERFSKFEALPLHHETAIVYSPLMRLLILVNKPVASQPPTLRAVIGIAAAMTLFNAVCLWAWILLR